MITFDGMDLFSSGPCAVYPGPLESRSAVANAPNAIGASVITQGVMPRPLTQRGTLVADDTDALQSLIDAIQASVGMGNAELIDQYGKAWQDCLMQRFVPAPIRRLGPGYSAQYEITYLQTHP